ncbi:Immunoglobulin lambda variable 5-37 [Bagarius yarrelli]|nr:Immunoglobulin lambda variable 5-37 [Bagarius yarrelli]
MIRILVFFQSLYWIQGIAGNTDVIQPSTLWVNMGQSATVNCSHTKGISYDRMYLFRQQPGQNMELIVYSPTYGTPDFGNFDESKFSVVKTVAESRSFTVKDVDYSDRAFAASKDVFQTPRDLFRTIGESLEIQCSHKISGYDRILWYKHSRDREYQLVGYNYLTTSQLEPDFNSQMTLTGNGNSKDSVFSSKVQQSPADLIHTRGQTVELNCLHSIEYYNIILWYRNSEKHTLDLIGYLWNSNDYVEPKFTEKIEMKGDGNKQGSLRIKNLSSADVLSEENGVTQTPNIAWHRTGESAELKCSHNKDASYFQMYWYRQRQGESMEFIVFTTTSADPEFGSVEKTKFSTVKKIAANGSLTVKDVDTEDSAVYFCAVRKHILSEENGVTQTPNIAWHRTGESAELKCSHNKDASYLQMYWYRQRQGESMEFIVYTTTSADPEFGSVEKTKFSTVKKIAANGSLTVKDVDTEDSAVYFCAVRKHSVPELLHH